MKSRGFSFTFIVAFSAALLFVGAGCEPAATPVNIPNQPVQETAPAATPTTSATTATTPTAIPAAPSVTDSDGDGLSDSEETQVYRTDSHNADTDGDGYLDGAEVKGGFDPNGPGKLYAAPEPVQKTTVPAATPNPTPTPAAASAPVVPAAPVTAPPPPTYVPEPEPEPESEPEQESEKYCCKICSTGKACGNSCISRSYTCHQPPGCACDAE
ncbi:MAG: hypothetical protein PHT12_06195 [Patescibacteria group bacterium]|nr:hypothetical protein [Patescibacteria group bacterium]